MTWKTLVDVRTATKTEFAKKLADGHHFVRLPSGRWTRTLGQPQHVGADLLELVHVRGRVWHLNSRPY